MVTIAAKAIPNGSIRERIQPQEYKKSIQITDAVLNGCASQAYAACRRQIAHGFGLPRPRLLDDMCLIQHNSIPLNALARIRRLQTRSIGLCIIVCASGGRGPYGLVRKFVAQRRIGRDDNVMISQRLWMGRAPRSMVYVHIRLLIRAPVLPDLR